MTFQTRNLTGERVSVKGTDVDGVHGETVLDASQWLELKARNDVKTAQADFDAAVEAFYAPLLEAAEQANKALERPTDSLAHVVLDEGQEAVAGRAPQIVNLTKDSMVLRLFEDGNTDRLIWIDGELEILEVLPGTHQSPAPVEANDSDVAAETTEASGYAESADRDEDPFA
jgi:hypothetical protein